MRVKGFRPMTDAPTCYGSIGARENLQSSVSYSTEQPVNSKGLCPANVSTRLARGRVRIPAGTAWTFATGSSRRWRKKACDELFPSSRPSL
jgi:hypothetical protein